MSVNNNYVRAAAPSGDPRQPFWKNVVAGGGAGAVEILVMYPTDVIKTRQQLGVGKTKGILQSFRDIISEEGAANLYRGISSPLLAEAPKRAVKFTCNELYKPFFAKSDGTIAWWGNSLAGASAGITECAVNTPFEVVKVRMQAKENLGRFKGPIDCVVQLVAERGPLGLYKGVESQMWRNAIWNGVYFGLIGALNRGVFKPPPGASKGEKMYWSFLGGVVGGTIATLANTPFDTVKSRMQNQITVPGQTPKYNWTLPSLVTVVREEGVIAAYKGLGPRLLRLGPGGGIMIVMFNFITELLEGY